MPFTGTGGQPVLPMSAPYINHITATSSSDDSTASATPGAAATWPPSAASSSMTSHMGSSAAVEPTITEINLVSSPPTSHAESPSRTRSSPLRPSLQANIIRSPAGSRGLGKAVAAGTSAGAQTEDSVASSDPEDAEHDADAGELACPQRPNSRSPKRSRKEHVTAADLDDDNTPSVYVQIPASSPSTLPPRESSASKRKPKSQQSTRSHRRDSDASDIVEVAPPKAVNDDAVYAAQIAAQEEALASRRPTRSARGKEVSYKPNCDLEGRPLKSKKSTTGASASTSSKLKDATRDAGATKKGTSKRRSRAFSDDEEDQADDGKRSEPGSSSKGKGAADRAPVEADADLTDDDVGFKTRDRKKAKVGKTITIEDDEDEDKQPDALDDDGILTPPALTSPRRSSRKSAPSPKKQQLEETAKSKKIKGKGKSQQSKTFDLDGEDEEAAEEDHEDEAEEVDAGPTKSGSSRTTARTGTTARTVKSASPEVEHAEKATEEKEEEEEHDVDERAEQAKQQDPSPPSHPSTSAKPSSTASSTSRPTPTSVAIKRLSTTSSPLLSPSSPGPRSFFGKPLTTLLTTSAARRPGLTRKTNIPSLLNHRGAPKPPAPQLAVSKRRMQDDDYEYDAEYEALIAKDKKGSDDEDGEEDEGEREGEEVEVEEYD